MTLERGQRWEHVRKDTGGATVYEVESFIAPYIGGQLVYLRNVETGGLAQVSSRQLFVGYEASNYFWRLAADQNAAAALERSAA